MIHVVTFENQHLYARQLEEMFRMRHEFYIRQRGWTNLNGEDGRETDEFDNEHAVYLMNLDRFGHILSTFRVNPTMTPYLLGDKLPEYLEGEPPRSEMIWDLTRWMVTPDARRKSAEEIADAQKQLICGVMEFSVDRGITHYTCLTDTSFVDRIQKVWPITRLGTPRAFDEENGKGNGEAIAVMIEAGPHILAQSRNQTGIFSPVLFELKPQHIETPETRKQKDKAMSVERNMPARQLDFILTAADHMVTELGSASAGDLDASIRAIDDFTRIIRDSARMAKLEDA